MFTNVIRRTAILAGLVGVTAAAGLTAYFHVLNPARAKPSSIEVRMTPERIARGKYLFTLADCDGCHSLRDFSRFGGPVLEGGRGQGNVMPAELGLPGLVAASNISSDRETGIGAWTDGEKIRAIREGISRDGTALFPMMPYSFYRHMSDEDVQDLVAYLNTLPPVKNRVPRSRIGFPVSMLIRTEPQPVSHVPAPDRRNPVAYGRYLTTLAQCVECHTKAEKGRPVKGMAFAGGNVIRFPGATVVTANITPDSESGLGTWSEQEFLDRFYQYRDYVTHGAPSVGPEGFTLMPWLNYSQLAPEDLKAIYTFLRTVKPVYHPVDTHPSIAEPVTGTIGTSAGRTS